LNQVLHVGFAGEPAALAAGAETTKADIEIAMMARTAVMRLRICPKIIPKLDVMNKLTSLSTDQSSGKPVT
jgi:hypothetical protein